MPVIIDGSSGITTPTYGGADTSEYLVPVTGFKNRIINGNMSIDQRNAGASVATSSGVQTFTVDRWLAFYSATSKYTVQQNAGSVTPPAGFTNYLGVTSSSAYSVGASERFCLLYKIEGYDLADLNWGTANAKTATLSFWVRSSLTGTFGGAFRNDAGDRSYPFTYTISAANTWEYKTVTLAGPTSGTFSSTNGTGTQIWFGLGVGSTVSGTAGSWANADFSSATGATSVVGTNGATFYITGVQLEVGSTATSFDYRPYGTELALCQRYYEKSYDIGTVPGTNTSVGRFQQTATSNGSGDMTLTIRFAVQKRTAPTMTAYAPGGTINKWARQSSGVNDENTLNWEFQSTGGTAAYIAVGNNTAVCASQGHWVASAEL